MLSVQNRNVYIDKKFTNNYEQTEERGLIAEIILGVSNGF